MPKLQKLPKPSFGSFWHKASSENSTLTALADQLPPALSTAPTSSLRTGDFRRDSPHQLPENRQFQAKGAALRQPAEGRR